MEATLPSQQPDSALLAQTLAAAPAGDLYVFAYGSLMWSPRFPYRWAKKAQVFGYSRRCAVFSTHYRGTPRRPGLVFGLDCGGSCNGVLYRIAAREKAAVMTYLFRREMFANVYRPCYVSARVRGRDERALTFVVRRDGRHYAAAMSDNAAVARIRRASGHGGSNREYVEQTYLHLQQLGIHSPMMARLSRLLARNDS